MTIKHIVRISLPGALTAMALAAAVASAQEFHPNRANLTFNHFYNYNEMVDALRELADAYPQLLTLNSIGKSTEERDIWLMTINNPETGSDRDKPAMYIDGNVHGNEVQGSEVCLYTIWHLTKSYGVVDHLTKLLDERAFYIIPSVNPDGRAHWFDNPNTAHASRSGKQPTDNDHDGLFDEDGYDDLDGDGQITSMWKKDPLGRFRRSQKDPRLFERVERDEKGDYDWFGFEGIDNDGDGEVNEDGPGGYDMNRNWPTDWQPGYIERGSGDYPLCFPETAAIAAFILDHPNIAAVQSYHNAGGMILRGPGTKERVEAYPRDDTRVYDEIAKKGERILPFYKYMVLWKDLYTVHGGFVNWTAEGLGIFSFTNELWTNAQLFGDPDAGWGSRKDRLEFGDLLLFKELMTPLKPYDHPTYGEVLIGGAGKYASRVPPLFMLEELCHRNFAFTMYHADQMPRLAFSRVEVKLLGAGIWQVTVEVMNDAAIPTISALAAKRKIGARDQVTLSPGGRSDAKVLASGVLETWHQSSMKLTERHPERIWLDEGIGSHGRRVVRWLVRGKGTLELKYSSQKGGTIARQVTLEASASRSP
ncbi:MAG: M14 family metallopeptidase [Phycisphaerae bacterium]|jgi:hypothetical protein